MLEHTFCHLPGVGLKTEKALWRRGIHTWHDLLSLDPIPLRGPAASMAPDQLATSRQRLADRDARYFSELLPAAETWRLFGHFRDRVAYLDIETTGLSDDSDGITCIGIFDGRRVQTFVQGENLLDFEDAIAEYDVLVTFNGRCFDVPVIERQFRMRLPQAHIDLRFVLRSLGYKGGLKVVEKLLGVAREGLDGVDGYFAVLLWQEYQRSHDRSVLDTLLAYNVADVIGLERLLVHAYNQKLGATPFYDALTLEPPLAFDNPFAPDPELVQRFVSLRWGRSGE
ncbi:MAG: ribonuclease H-like domain-containing protein [Pseudomonadota bacterium]